MLSKRTYVVVVVVFDGGAPACHEMNLAEIIQPKQDDWEFIYALNENYIDELLDLQPLDILPFKANRDNDKHKGVIIRKT